MNDFLKIEKTILRESLDLNGLDCYSRTVRGPFSFSKYFLKRKGILNLTIEESTGRITLDGNIGMYWQGHNFDLSRAELANVLNEISEGLQVDLFEGVVREFDHSIILKVEDLPNSIIRHHHEIPYYSFTKYTDHGRRWTRKRDSTVSLYNATKRMKQLPIATRKLIEAQTGFTVEDFLVRFECKYLKPSQRFKTPVYGKDMVSPEFMKQCNDDLLERYQSISKSAGISIEGLGKAGLTTPMLFLIYLEEKELGPGLSEWMNRFMRTEAGNILTRDDRKARKKQLSNLRRKIAPETGSSPFDLTAALERALYEESSVPLQAA